MRESLRPVLVLTAICVACSALLAFAHHSLGPRVEQQTDLFVRGPALSRLFGQPAEYVHKASFHDSETLVETIKDLVAGCVQQPPKCVQPS